MKGSLEKYLAGNSSRVDRLLELLMRRRPEQPETIRKAMSYSLFAGGKRLRPTLVIAAAQCCGGRADQVLKTAAALEMIHTYSLIHDDLPAMDDDDLRRGKPTNHKVFGEAVAILAGDGLLTYAFELVAENALERRLSARNTAELIRVVARGAGTQGMVGGQVADLEAEAWRDKNHGFDPARALEYIHLHKTAALIAASLEAGAILAGGSAAERRALRDYGDNIGLAFQIADDVLDVVGDKKKLGKRGSDSANDKLTYVSLYGVDKARAKARELVTLAKKSLRRLDRFHAPLLALADFIVNREK
ncbi:MAG: polyprenyl synthetase family protein [Elusimicrobia bacterium]|nr:polyprenyl synthetase family protein [Elusimicrobiota bacterium]